MKKACKTVLIVLVVLLLLLFAFIFAFIYRWCKKKIIEHHARSILSN